MFSRDDVTILRNIGCGNFGEVQLALIPHDIKNTRAQKHFRMSEKDNSALSSNLVVVKRLKGKYAYNIRTCVYIAFSSVKAN